jgi:hypothetical protein
MAEDEAAFFFIYKRSGMSMLSCWIHSGGFGVQFSRL